jgi:hypothetical protein
MVQLFVGSWPPPKVRAVLSHYPRPAVEGMRWSTPSQWLVVIRPLGHVADDLVPDLTTAIEAGIAGTPAVRASLDSPRRGEWLEAPVRGLEELVDEVFEATQHLVPVTHPHKRWGTHLVLARGRSRIYEPQPLAAAWTVATVVLAGAVRSHDGPGYETIITFRLGRGPR